MELSLTLWMARTSCSSISMIGSLPFFIRVLFCTVYFLSCLLVNLLMPKAACKNMNKVLHLTSCLSQSTLRCQINRGQNKRGLVNYILEDPVSDNLPRHHLGVDIIWGGIPLYMLYGYTYVLLVRVPP